MHQHEIDLYARGHLGMNMEDKDDLFASNANESVSSARRSIAVMLNSMVLR